MLKPGARAASGGRHGLAQSVFQVGGNAGTAVGPLLAAYLVLPGGQKSVAWFSLAALTACVARLHSLLQDPHPGLCSWMVLVGADLEEVSAYCPNRPQTLSANRTYDPSFSTDT